MQHASPFIEFHFETRSFTLAHRKALKAFVPALFKAYKIPLGSLVIIFTTDKSILKLNRSYLQHDYLTDILTFTLSESGLPIEGEIYISIDRVRENARHFQEPFYRELHRVIFHGCLHLCGLEDKSKSDQAMMRQTEERFLKKYFVSR